MGLSKISWFASGESAEANNDLRDIDSLRKNRRRGVCDSLLLILYGGHVIVPFFFFCSWNMCKMI